MYAASNAFHEAVRNGAEQKALLIFSDAVFTGEDIDIDTGIAFDGYFNLEEGVAIGQTPSSEIRFALFNDRRLLNDYGFGEFMATLGVKIGDGSYTAAGNCAVTTDLYRYTGYDTSPYLRRRNLNGGSETAMASQPDFAVKSLLAYGGKLWAFGASQQYAVYNEATGANITAQNPVNAFMREKSTRWGGKGFYFNADARILSVYAWGHLEEFEFVPLGVFESDRPNVPDQLRIELTCNDRMQLLDVDMPDKEALGITYPTTIGTLFTKICNYARVPYRSNVFINSTAEIQKEPEDFSSVTMRTVMGWIAEAAGSNARIDRDGYLVLDWLKTTTQSYSETDYTDMQVHWYETEQITKLYNRDTQEGKDVTRGDGNVGYLIQDNPLLKGAV